MGYVYVVGTADTKGAELGFLAARVREAGAAALTVDLGTRPAPVATDIAAVEVAACHPDGMNAVLGLNDRGAAVAAMGEAFARFVRTRDDIAAIVGIGGGGGTSIATAGMRELPFGVPKIMVSTLASGDVAPYVGVSDIVMMPAVADIAGLNRITRSVLSRAAQAIVAMTRAAPVADARPALGLTMFGVTTPCVTRVAEALGEAYDCLVFHATGTGGRTMEKLADDGELAGVIDVTTTEVCDHLLGGVLSAGPDRLSAIARTGIPYVGSCGALDMVNFWAPDTVPERYRGRTFHRHNPNVTLMRTTPEECRGIAAWIAARLNACEGPVRFLMPERGVSALDAPGAAFHDPEADAALFDTLESELRQTKDRRLVRLPLHINDPDFADALVAAWQEIAPTEGRPCQPSPAPTS
jgi:uncharacterized protein (UPF0261 family)